MNSESSVRVSHANRSSFISGLAWTFIACAAIGALIVGAQLVAVSTVFPAEEMRAVLREMEKSQPLPAFVGYAFDHLSALLASLLALCVVTLVASLGLLARHNWGRLSFIVLAVIGALWNLAGAIAPIFFLLESFSTFPMIQELPPELRGGVEILIRMVLWVSIGTGLVFAGLFVWLAKRLAAEDIRREFAAQ
jgi:hypothetical protein